MYFYQSGHHRQFIEERGRHNIHMLTLYLPTKQVMSKLLKNVLTYLKRRLESREFESYSWIETKAMTADVLNTEGGLSEQV